MTSNVIDLWTRRPIQPDSLFWPEANRVRVGDGVGQLAESAHWATSGSAPETMESGEGAEGAGS